MRCLELHLTSADEMTEAVCVSLLACLVFAHVSNYASLLHIDLASRRRCPLHLVTLLPLQTLPRTFWMNRSWLALVIEQETSCSLLYSLGNRVPKHSQDSLTLRGLCCLWLAAKRPSQPHLLYNESNAFAAFGSVGSDDSDAKAGRRSSISFLEHFS